MINRSIPMARKVFGLFVDDGSLALSILVWIFALHVVAANRIYRADLGCTALVLGMCRHSPR